MAAMAYTPVELTKDGKTILTSTLEEEVERRFDGWLPTGSPPPDHSWDVVRVRDLGDPASPARAELGAAFGLVAAVAAGGSIQAGIDALPTNGGAILFLPGDHSFSTPLNFDGKKNVTLLGMGSGQVEATIGNTPPTRLIYTGTGSAAAISARNTQSFLMRDLQVTHTQSSFTGYLVDVSGSADPNASFFPRFDGCRLGGDYTASRRTARAAVFLGNTVEASFRDCVIHDCQYGVEGPDQGATWIFATEALFDNVKFEGLAVAGALNPHIGWQFTGNTAFEPAASGAPGGIVCQVPADTLRLTGCSFWDATAAGNWIEFKGSGLYISGGTRAEVPNGGALVEFNGACSGGGIDFASVKGSTGAVLAKKAGGATLSNWRVGQHNQIDLGVDSGTFRTPTATVGASAGSGATAPSISGVDEAFSITFSTGTSPTNGVVAHVAFAVPYLAPPRIFLQGGNIAGANGSAYTIFPYNIAADGFDIYLNAVSGTPPAGVSGGWLLECAVVGGRQTNA